MLLVASVLLVAPLASAQEAPFAPDSEVAGFLWPAAFGLYGSRTVVVDVPVAYFVDTVATIRLELDDWNGSRYTDMFTLLKVDGEWTIMNKVFHLHS